MGVQLSKPTPPRTSPDSSSARAAGRVSWHQMQNELDQAGHVPSRSILRAESVLGSPSASLRRSAQSRAHTYDPTSIHEGTEKGKRGSKGRHASSRSVRFEKKGPSQVTFYPTPFTASKEELFHVPQSKAQLEHLTLRQRRALLSLAQVELRMATDSNSETQPAQNGASDEATLSNDRSTGVDSRQGLIDPAFGQAVESAVFAHAALPRRGNAHRSTFPDDDEDDGVSVCDLPVDARADPSQLLAQEGTWAAATAACAARPDGLVDPIILDPLLSPAERSLLQRTRRQYEHAPSPVKPGVPPTAGPTDSVDPFDEISPPVPTDVEMRTPRAVNEHTTVPIQGTTTGDVLRRTLARAGLLMHGPTIMDDKLEEAYVDAIVEEALTDVRLCLSPHPAGLPCLVATVGTATLRRPIQHRLDKFATDGAAQIVEDLVVALCTFVARACHPSAGSPAVRQRGDVEGVLNVLANLCRDLRSGFASDVLRHVPHALLFDVVGENVDKQNTEAKQKRSKPCHGTALQAFLHASPEAALAWVQCAVYASLYHTTGDTGVVLAESLAELLCGAQDCCSVPGLGVASGESASFASMARKTTSVAAMLLPRGSTDASSSSSTSKIIPATAAGTVPTHPTKVLAGSFRCAARFDRASGAAGAFDAPTSFQAASHSRLFDRAPIGKGGARSPEPEEELASVEQWVEWVGIAAEAAVDSPCISTPTGQTLLHVGLGYLIAIAWRDGHSSRALALEAHFPSLAAVSHVVLAWMASQEASVERPLTAHTKLARVLCRWPRLSRWLHVSEFAADGHFSGVVSAATLCMNLRRNSIASPVPWRFVVRGLFTPRRESNDEFRSAAACPFAAYATSIDPTRGGNGCVCSCAYGV